MSRSGSPPAEPPAGWHLSWDELARTTGATVERLRRLVELGVIWPADGQLPFRSGDVHRARAVAALEATGVAVEEIAAAIKTGELSVGYLDYVMQPPPATSRPARRPVPQSRTRWSKARRCSTRSTSTAPART